jgi:hypothetical protein
MPVAGPGSIRTSATRNIGSELARGVGTEEVSDGERVAGPCSGLV